MEDRLSGAGRRELEALLTFNNLLPPAGDMDFAPADSTPHFSIVDESSLCYKLGRVLGPTTDEQWTYVAESPGALELIGRSVLHYHVYRYIDTSEELTPLGGRYCRPFGEQSFLAPHTTRWILLRALAQYLAQKSDETDVQHLMRCTRYDRWAAIFPCSRPSTAVLLLRQLAAFLSGELLIREEGLVAEEVLLAPLRVPPELRLGGGATVGALIRTPEAERGWWLHMAEAQGTGGGEPPGASGCDNDATGGTAMVVDEGPPLSITRGMHAVGGASAPSTAGADAAASLVLSDRDTTVLGDEQSLPSMAGISLVTVPAAVPAAVPDAVPDAVSDAEIVTAPVTASDAVPVTTAHAAPTAVPTNL
jgi:hypothetical protein